MVADTVDAMTTTRPYRAAMSFERVIVELRNCAGSQFDPTLVEVVLRSNAVRALVAARVSAQGERAFPSLEVLTSSGRSAARA